MTRLLAFLLLLANPVHALSCLRPDAVRLYTQAAESEERFVIFVGRLFPENGIEVPDAENNQSTVEATTRVRLTGLALGRRDFRTALDEEIDVRVTCLATWCGWPVTDRDILGALRVTENGHELEFDPCSSMSMPAEEADLDALLRCHRSGSCRLE